MHLSPCALCRLASALGGALGHLSPYKEGADPLDPDLIQRVMRIAPGVQPGRNRFSAAVADVVLPLCRTTTAAASAAGVSATGGPFGNQNARQQITALWGSCSTVEELLLLSSAKLTAQDCADFSIGNGLDQAVANCLMLSCAGEGAVQAGAAATSSMGSMLAEVPYKHWDMELLQLWQQSSDMRKTLFSMQHDMCVSVSRMCGFTVSLLQHLHAADVPEQQQQQQEEQQQQQLGALAEALGLIPIAVAAMAAEQLPV